MISLVAMGWLSDRVSVFYLLAGSAIVSAVITFTLWLMAETLSCFLLFSFLFGLFTGGYTSMYSRFVTEVTADGSPSMWLFGIFAFQRGIGYILAGPISGALLKLDAGKIGDASADAYKPVILFVGVSLLVSAIGGIGHCYRPKCNSPS